MNKGQYRDGDWAQVTDGTVSMPIPRNTYEERGYAPPFEDLPTKENYQGDD